MRGNVNGRGARGANRSRGPGSISHGASSYASATSAPNDSNPFDKEQLQNNVKRKQKDQHTVLNGLANGKIKMNGLFQEVQEQKAASTSKPRSEENPFGHTSKPLAFGAGASPPNPFASVVFGAPSNSVNPSMKLNSFGAPSGPVSNTYGMSTSTTSSNSVWPRPANRFGSEKLPNQFQKASNGTNVISDASELSQPPSRVQNVFPMALNKFSESVGNTGSIFGPKITANEFPKPPMSFSSSPQINLGSNVKSTSPRKIANSASSTTQQSLFAQKIDAQLRKERITPPSIAILHNTAQPDVVKTAAEGLRREFLKHRERVRTSLIRANLLDDPNVPKKLSDAIDFKGTCNDMCPEFEVVSRIVDRRYDKAEKDVLPDGSLTAYPNPIKMVKALARSAAGQDAPLPNDIRTAAALRRTVDYLFNVILGEKEIELVHGFLWDRTRAIRRDFVFHSSMSPSELVDQVYCLERITRFHAIALHQMSKDGISSEGFSDQQEREQLSKSLLSLIHAYEDCKIQGVNCENEIEFKAYYILFNGEIPGIMETVQNWGWELWGNSEIIRIAISLSESLQNTWDIHGPLNPFTTTEVSQNAYCKFFSIIEDPNVSYTMACFAEIYFNKVRKAILSTILTSYRKQRGQTKDWTSKQLNKILRFDHEDEVEPFVELYGLHFTDTDGEWCLSFNSANHIDEPHPYPRQPHSYHLVERKLGKRSLSEAIDHSVYEEANSLTPNDDGLYVADTAQTVPVENADPEFIMANGVVVNPGCIVGTETTTVPEEEAPKPRSLFDTIGRPKSLSQDFFSNLSQTKSTDPVSISAPVALPWLANKAEVAKTPIFASQPETSESCSQSLSPSIIPQQTLESSVRPGSPFSFLNPPVTQPVKSAITKVLIGNAAQVVTSAAPISAPFLVNSSKPAIPHESRGLLVVNDEKNSISTQSQQSSLLPVTSATFTPPSNPSPNFSLKESSPRNQPLDTLKIVSSILPDTDANGGVDSRARVTIQPPSRQHERLSRLDALAKWIVNGDEGLLEQFYEFQARIIVRNTFDNFAHEQQMQAQKEAEIQARSQADQFRWYSLAVKYGYYWREQARRLWLKRKGREARQARREMAQQSRAEKAAFSTGLVEDFRVSTRERRKDSSQSLTDATRTLSGVNAIDSEINAITGDDVHVHERHRLRRSTTSHASSTSRDKQGNSENALRHSILSDPSYLSGESRMHLVSKFVPTAEKRQANGVQTDYFRLKARGISTFPDSTPTLNRATTRFPHEERSSDVVEKSPKNLPPKHSSTVSLDCASGKFSGVTSFGENEIDIASFKSRTRSFTSEGNKKQKRHHVEDDELFERAKRIRDQMDEGASWFRKEIQKDSKTRSVS